jgi:hypothetical protein
MMVNHASRFVARVISVMQKHIYVIQWMRNGFPQPV